MVRAVCLTMFLQYTKPSRMGDKMSRVNKVKVNPLSTDGLAPFPKKNQNNDD